MRIQEAERSYAKEHTFLNKRNFYCKSLIGRDFDKYPNSNKVVDDVIKGLSKRGKRLISKFIEKNKKKEEEMKKKEKNFFTYLHSKPPLILNDWKFSNHIIEEFSTPKLDKIYSFTVASMPKNKSSLLYKHK